MNTKRPAQWFRMYSEFANDPKVQRLSEADQRRFVMLLCLRCCNGNVTLRNGDVTFQLRISDEEWAKTKANFVEKGLVDEDNNVLNWDKRQYASDSSTERVSKHRDRMKRYRNVTVTPPETETENKKEIDKEKRQTANPAVLPCEEGSSRSKKGTRLPADWHPGPDGLFYLERVRPELDFDAVLENFTNYWTAKAGANAVKLDWLATWKNWVKNEKAIPVNLRKTNNHLNGGEIYL